MMPKPKSAPPRMTSKYASNRTTARKEIEAWVKKDADPLTGNFESLRMSGQLTDNITEERMLKAKLLELSKERYKFLSQNSYEKKVFIDRMMRKSSAMRRVMSANQTGEARSPTGTYKKRTNNARYALLERMDPTKNRKKGPPEPKECEKKPNEGRNKKCVKFISTFSKEETLLYSDSGSDETATKRRLDSRPNETMPTELGAVVRGVIEQKIIEDQKPWLIRGNRNSIRRKESSSHFKSDPRYCELQHKLCPVTKKTNIDIHSVVRKIESLHVQPKLPKDGKPKVEMKAIAFMKKKGFVFA